MKKKVIKLIFDIMISLVGLAGFVIDICQIASAEKTYLTIWILSLIGFTFAVSFVIFVFIPLDIEAIKRSKRNEQEK